MPDNNFIINQPEQQEDEGTPKSAQKLERTRTKLFYKKGYILFHNTYTV